MPDYAKRIDELTNVRAKQLDECSNLLRSLGSRLAALEGDDRPEEMSELLDRHDAALARIEAARGAIERMLHIDERQSEIRAEMKQLQDEDDQLDKGLAPTYEKVGAVAFRLFKEHPLVDQSYSAAFEELAKYQDEMRHLDAKLSQLTAAGANHKRSVIERISSGGRDLLLRNRRTAKANQLPKLLRDAGKRLCKTDFVDEMEDDELTEAAAPYRAAVERHEAIEQRLSQLSEESGQLVRDFNELSGGTRLTKAQAAREKEIENARGDLNVCLDELGRGALTVRPKPLTGAIEEYEAAEQRREHFESLLSRLQAGRQAELTASEIERKNARIAAIKDELAAAQSELKRLKGEQTEQLERRGEEAELFDD